MKNRQWLRMLCLALSLCTVFSLCACGPTQTPEHTHAGGTATCTQKAVCDECGETYGSLAAHQYVEGVCSVCGASEGGSGSGEGGEGSGEGDKNVPAAYPNGGAVEGAGATLPEGSKVLTATTYDAATAEDVKSNAFFRSAVKEAGKVFKVSDGKAVSISSSAGQTYDGKGSILITPAGLEISASHDIVLMNLVIVGPVSVKGTASLTFENVEIISDATALSLDAESSEFKMANCRLTGKTALTMAGNNSVVLNSYLAFTDKGIVDTAEEGTTVQHCVLEGSGTAIDSVASEAAYKNLTITMGEADTGIVLGKGVLNTIAALNVITGAQKSVSLTETTNTVVILSSLVSVEANDNVNLYVCDNQMGGRLTANNNNYFLANDNVFPEDEWSHETVQTGNQNHNGNTLMDVDARLEVGADEALLPHINRDQFVGMERKDKVKDLMDEEPVTITNYILEHCKTDEHIIIAPGAYATDGSLPFRAEHSNSTIYAYGVYMERQTGLGQLMNYNSVENVTIKGMTIGFKQQSCGQVYVLDKLPATGGKYYLLVVTGAGMMNEFGNTDTRYYDTTGMGAQRMGTFYAYADAGFNNIQKLPEDEGVPVMKMEVTKYWYEIYRKGDIFTCRAVNGGTTIGIHTNTKNVKFIDFNIYGAAAGFAYVEQDALTATTYYRVCDTTRSGEIIDEATYNAYLALEEKYGVDLEVEIDELGRFRGSPAHIGSIDATHTTRCGEGSLATSCLFENMCDDATNQNATHGRIASAVDNGDGTTTITYKGNYSEYSYGYSEGKPGTPSGFCYDFKEGDRVFIYTSDGQLVADTPALSATKRNAGSKTFSWTEYGVKGGATVKVEYRTVKVATDAVNFEALARFNLDDDSWKAAQKVLIDNMDMSSNNFVFDNCKFQNIRSRGLLIKASGGKIVNCTFRNIGMACAAILYEIYWGESGVTENMLVDRNLIDHTGYFKNQDRYSPVSVEGLGMNVAEDYLLYKNIVITNNKIINRTTDYAVFINSAKDVVIKDNYFGEFVGNDFGQFPEEPESMDNPKPVIHINGAMNVEISGNRFPETEFIQFQVVAERNKNVFGSDVEMDGLPLIPDSED